MLKFNTMKNSLKENIFWLSKNITRPDKGTAAKKQPKYETANK